LCLTIPVIFLPAALFAKVGVGVGTGKIKIDQKLKPGMIYDFPNFSVFNTGDEPGEYEVDISFRSGQEELKPEKDWFVFSPQNFQLEPGDAQSVELKMKLPLKVEPGDYFCFLQGKPSERNKGGSASVGIAAASKLYFTVAPANVLSAVYYRGLHFWQDFYPWPMIVLGAVTGFILFNLLRRKFGLSINVQFGKNKERDSEISEEIQGKKQNTNE